MFGEMMEVHNGFIGVFFLIILSLWVFHGYTFAFHSGINVSISLCIQPYPG